MANEVALTAANIRNASPVDLKASVINLIAGVAITAGQVVYMNTSGLAALADASNAGTATVAGIALEGASAGQPVPVLVSGFCAGFTLTSETYGEILLLSDTAGAIDDGGGSPAVDAPVGVVWSLGDSSATKVIWVNAPYNLIITPS
jgi:hypothetical protein